LDFDIFDLPSVPRMRRAGVENGLGFREDEAESVVELACEFARQFEVLRLVFAERERLPRDARRVGGLKHRITRSPAFRFSACCADLSLYCV
jgi:hypothetical protein